MNPTTLRASAAFSILFAAGAAFGQSSPLQFNFQYQRLSGAYNDSLSQFTANAVDIPSQITSEGIVSRNASPGGAANFQTNIAGQGFTTQAPQAGYSMTVSVFNRIGQTASGSGSLVCSDVFGNKFVGTVTGSNATGNGWSALGSFIFFQGTLSNVFFIPAQPGNTLFTGVDGSSFNFTTFPGPQPFDGAIVSLSISTSGGFFNPQGSNNNFGYNGSPGSAVPTQVSGQLVPSPAGTALLGLAGIAAGRRRRR